MSGNFELLEDQDVCPVCGDAVQIVIEETGRGTEVRHSGLYDVHKDPDTPDGVVHYYLHFNRRP